MRSLPQLRQDSDSEFAFSGTATVDPDRVIDWVLRRFEGWNRVMTTSFGMEGCALIDLLARRDEPFRVVYVDTGFFFEETYALRDQMVRRYPHLTFIEARTSLSPEDQEREHGAALWETAPDVCCQIRKVEPMRQVLRDVDVWMTGLRRDQTEGRRALRAVEWDLQYDVLKVSPLAHWTRADVWSYVKAQGVPYNPLHDKGYPSIGCTHCTVRVDGLRIDEYSRDGRWSGTGKTECGLHDRVGDEHFGREAAS